MPVRRRFSEVVQLVLIPSLLAAATASASEPQSWPQWRGPQRDGVLHDVPAWPASLKGLERVWQVDLGPSYSGPIVVADRVFVTETINDERECVRALDRKTGRELWKAEWPGAMDVPFFARERGDWIRATPACDGESLYVAGMRDLLVCLDAQTGKERWRADLAERYGTALPAFGFVSSPLVVGDDLYVQAGGGFLKLDKRTGETRWRSLEDGGGMMGGAFSSPIMTKLAGRSQLVVQTRTTLAGVNPSDGGVLWSQVVPSFRGMNILTPTVAGDRIFTSSYRNNSFLYEIKPASDGLTVDTVWTSKPKAYMCSPVVVDGHAYFLLQNRRFACVDLKSGDETWRSDESLGEYCSLVANDRMILALSDRGELFLLKANPEKFELVDRAKVADSDTWAHLAICGDELFVRALDKLIVWRWPQKSAE